MPTNPLGSGTCNLSVNVPKAWRRFLGRKAFVIDVSMGELVRRIIVRASYFWKASAVAMTAEHADIEAFEILRRAISDGVQAEDLPEIERAMRLILTSARIDDEMAQQMNLNLEGDGHVRT